MNKIFITSIKSLFIGVITIMAFFAGSTQSVVQAVGIPDIIDITPADLPDRISKQIITTSKGNFVFITVAGYAFEKDGGNPIFGPTGAPEPTSPADPNAKSDDDDWPLLADCPDGTVLEAKQCPIWYYAFFLFKADEDGVPTSPPLSVLKAHVNVLATRHLVAASTNGRVVSSGSNSRGKEAPTLESHEVEFIQAGGQGPIFGSITTDVATAALVRAQAANKQLNGFVGTQGSGDPLLLGAISAEQCTSFAGGGSMSLVRENGCDANLAEVLFFDSADCGTAIPETGNPGVINTAPGDFECSGPYAGCEECIFESQNSPYFVKFELNGEAVSYCYDFDGLPADCNLGAGATCIDSSQCLSGNCSGGTCQ